MFKTVGISAREVMDNIVEHFPTTEISETEKPLFVRIKRKVDQCRLDAFWLEINERPSKRPFMDLQKLSLSNYVSQEDEKKSRKVFMQHVTTVESSEASSDILRSYTPFSKDIHEPDGYTKRRDGKYVSKNENKQEQLLYETGETEEKMGKTTRFEQIWKKRRGEKCGVDSGGSHETFHVYDIVRVEVDERIRKIKHDRDEISLEDQAILQNFLPLLREYIPSAATEIEADIKHCSYGDTSAGGDHVYDVYAVKCAPDMVEDDDFNLFPMVQVEEDDCYTNAYEDEYASDDSNAEENSKNDYPDEESSDGEERIETENDEYESSSDAEDSEGTIGDGDEGDGVSEEKWKWSYR